MIDDRLSRPMYLDEIWWVPVDWTDALEDDALAGDVVVTPVGMVIEEIQQVGNVTRIRVRPGPVPSRFARIELVAPTSSAEKLGYNLGTPTRARNG